MNGLVSNIILSATVLMLSAQQHLPQSGNVGGGLPCGPVPSENQLRWQGQTVRCNPTRAKVIRVEGLRLAQGDRMGYSDVEVLTEK